jgi:glycine/D-amino acid oxidase-like deaminating enzyme/nitrite reductase/ring-hydroxylating ferredoxin subunit
MGLGSYWLAVSERTSCPSLARNLHADVAVIGGGIVGLTTALLLQQAGRKVVLLEARRVGGQVTGGSTAKITSLHKLIYADLVDAFDEETAAKYGRANEEALAFIGHTVRRHTIQCDFVHRDAYTYCTDEGAVEAVRREAETAERLGLPASFTQDLPRAFGATAAVRFTGQAQFHPVKYVHGLADALLAAGGDIFEETRVADVQEGPPHTLQLADTPASGGAPAMKVTADHVVVATNLPFLDRGGFFTKAYPRHHVAAAARLEGEPGFADMYVNTGTPTRSVRLHRDERGDVLIATGASFRPGEADPLALANDLESWLRARFPVTAIEHVWTNEDFDSMDRMPFVGRLRSGADGVWTATGFSAWGITGGTAAARVLADLVCNQPNPFAEMFDATRKTLTQSAKSFVSANVKTGADLVKGRVLGGERRDPETLAAGEAAVVIQDREKVAAYRDPAGVLHRVSAICTHMGCVVAWDPVAKAWDCPCHGSRFTPDGAVVFGPAVAPLPPSGKDRPSGK